MIEPIEYQLSGKTYLITKIPAMAGLEILLRFSSNTLRKLEKHEDGLTLATRLLSFVFVKIDGSATLALDSQALIDNHVKDVWDLLRIGQKMIDYNFDFFLKERIWTSYKELLATLPTLITKMFTESLEPSLRKIWQNSTN